MVIESESEIVEVLYVDFGKFVYELYMFEVSCRLFIICDKVFIMFF